MTIKDISLLLPPKAPSVNWKRLCETISNEAWGKYQIAEKCIGQIIEKRTYHRKKNLLKHLVKFFTYARTNGKVYKNIWETQEGEQFKPSQIGELSVLGMVHWWLNWPSVGGLQTCLEHKLSSDYWLFTKIQKYGDIYRTPGWKHHKTDKQTNSSDLPPQVRWIPEL